MSKNYIFLFVMIIMLVTGCTSVATKDIEVDAASDPKVNFSGYKSYAWLGSAAIVNDAYGQWEPPAFDADAEITFLLDRELRARGMSEDTSDPDLVVAFAAGIDMDALGLKTDPETKTDMSVVHIVGCANGCVVHRISLPPKLFHMAIKPLKFNEKGRFWKVAIHNSN